MTRVERLAACLAFALAASASASASVSASAPPLEVAVSRSGGEWTADFHFPRRAGVAYALGEDGTPRLR